MPEPSKKNIREVDNSCPLYSHEVYSSLVLIHENMLALLSPTPINISNKLSYFHKKVRITDKAKGGLEGKIGEI